MNNAVTEQDKNAVRAMKTLRDYCLDMVCWKCVFRDRKGGCSSTFDDIPSYWDVDEMEDRINE